MGAVALCSGGSGCGGPPQDRVTAQAAFHANPPVHDAPLARPDNPFRGRLVVRPVAPSRVASERDRTEARHSELLLPPVTRTMPMPVLMGVAVAVAVLILTVMVMVGAVHVREHILGYVVRPRGSVKPQPPHDIRRGRVTREPDHEVPLELDADAHPTGKESHPTGHMRVLRPVVRQVLPHAPSGVLVKHSETPGLHTNLNRSGPRQRPLSVHIGWDTVNAHLCGEPVSNA